jgi:hypothetical protein
LGETFLRRFEVALGRGLGLLFESIQHVYGIGKTGAVDHPISAGVVTYPDFFDTLANRGHGFEVVRLLASLHLIELITRILPGVLGKIPQTIEGIAEESHEFDGDDYTGSDISGASGMVAGGIILDRSHELG